MHIETFRTSETYEQALDRAARIWGIEPEYSDTWGKRHVTPPEVKKSILSALAVPAETKEDLDRSLEERLWTEWTRLVPPVVVLPVTDWARGFPVHLPADWSAAELSIEFRWEEAGTERHQLSASTLKETGRAELRGASFLRRALPLRRDVPLGYHEVDIRAVFGREEKTGRLRLIVCPNRTYAPEFATHGKRAGVAISLFGLRSARNWGCGDFTDLEGIADWLAAETGAVFIGLNPLHATTNRQPFNISPYLPSSTFYKNPLYLDPDRVEDCRNSSRAQGVCVRADVRAEKDALRAAEHIEYERIYSLKLRVLKLAFAAFLFREWRRDTERAREFRRYVEREGELLDRYATWCALDAHIHARQPEVWIWPDWPAEYRDPDSEATRAFAKKHWRAVLFHKYLQWQVDIQLAAAQEYARGRGLEIGLFHDLALATDQFGSDLWAWRPFYVSGCRVGSPPDGFSPKGQDWAFPPPNAEHHRETGYRLFVESIRKNARHGGALRIDHAMRFFRLYWIPRDMEPTRGAYVRDHYEDLLRILALESVRQQVVVVGEDLGTVTPEIRRVLDSFGLFGYKVPYFEKHDNGTFKLPQQYAEQAVVSSSTHDLPTLAGFWVGRDIEARRQAGLLSEQARGQALADRNRDRQKLLDALFALNLLPTWVPRRAEHIRELTGELHNAFVGWLALAPSRLMVLNQEDLLKEIDQQNLPATTSEYPNWRRRMRFSIEQLRDAHAARDYTAMLRSWLERTGRLDNQPAQRW